MSNVNEKNLQVTQKVTLDSQGRFDPRTNEKEGRAIVAVPFPGIEPRCPLSPECKLEQWFWRRAPQDAPCVQSPILPVEHEESPEEPSVSQDSFSTTTNAEPENGESDNPSLPLSDSIISVAEKPETAPSLNDILDDGVSTQITSGIRSLGTIEELDEEETANIDDPTEENLTVLDIPVMHDDAHISEPYAASQLLAPSDWGSTITDQIMEDSLLALASNNAGATLQQTIDTPLGPGPSSLPLPVIETNPAAVLSPLVLAPPLTVEDILTFSLADTDPIQVEKLTEDLDDKTPRPSTAPLISLLVPEMQHRFLGGARLVLMPTPSAPCLGTIPLPPFSTEENAGLFFSERFADSGLGLIVPKNSTTNVQPVVASNGSGDIPSDYTECKESQVIVEEGEGLAPARNLTKQGSPSVYLCPLAITPEPSCPSIVASQTHLTVGQVNMIENEIRSTMDTLNFTSDTPTLCSQTAAGQVPETLTLGPEGEAVVSNTYLEKPASAIYEIKSHADATNITMQCPKLTREALQTPIFYNHSASTVDGFTEKIEEREGPEHTLDRPNWAKAPVEGDSPSVSSVSRARGDALNDKRHAAKVPNWAVGPILEHIHSPKSGRERGRNRTRRGKKAQVNSTVENPQPILIQKAPTISVVHKATKEDFEALSQVMPQIQFVPTGKQRKAAANRQKVSKWMKDSASVMVSPKSCAERRSMTAASWSAFLMDSVSKRVINEDMGEAASFVKKPLSPTSRMAKTLTAQEAQMRGFHSYNEFVKAGMHSGTSSVPITSADEHMDGTSLLQDNRKTTFDKGKKPMTKNPSPVGRQRSASVSSSLASGISTRSGVSSSSRLFQHAIQQIGSPACPRSASVDHTRARQIPAPGQDEAKEPLETANAATESPEPLRQSPTTPIATTAVICPEMMVTQVATENCVPLLKGRVEASAPLRHIREFSNHTGSNYERFTFSFQHKQASIASEDHKKQERSRDSITLYTMKLGSATEPTVRDEGDVMKTQRATSLRTFIPRGKSVPPPIREGQMERQTQAPPAPLATSAPPPGATTTSQAQDAPQSAQYPGTPVALAVTLGLNRYTQPINLSDDTFTQAQYQAFFSSPAGTTSNDVNDDTRFGTARRWSSCVEEECENVRPMSYNHNGQVNANLGSLSLGANTNKPDFERFSPARCTACHANGLHARQGRVVRVLQVTEEKSCLQIPHQKMNYLSRSALAQEKQQDMSEFTDIAPRSRHSEPETFNATMIANQFQSLNVGAYESRVNFGQTILLNEPRSLLQPPVCAQVLNPNLVPQPSLPPRLQNQTGIPLTPHGLFEEYSRRQRQGTRTVHGNMALGVLRRKS